MEGFDVYIKLSEEEFRELAERAQKYIALAGYDKPVEDWPHYYDALDSYKAMVERVFQIKPTEFSDDYSEIVNFMVQARGINICKK